MDFDASQQFRPASPSSSLASYPQQNMAQVMYPHGSYPGAQQQATQLPMTSHLTPQFGQWPAGASAAPAAAYPALQRQSTSGPSNADGRAMSSGQAPSLEIRSLSRPGSTTSTSTRIPITQPTVTTQAEMLSSASLASGQWAQKHMSDADFSLDADMSDLNAGMLNHDEDTPIIDMRQSASFDGDETQNAFNLSRRMSESSFSISSTGPVADVTNYEEFANSVAGSERLSLLSESDMWNGFELPASTCSPTTSPRHSFNEPLKMGSRSRASTPYNVRASPYTMETTRNKRWSTGTYAPAPVTPQRTMSQVHRNSLMYNSPLNPSHSNFTNPHHSTINYGIPVALNYGAPMQPMLYSQPPQLQPHGANLFSAADQFAPEIARQLPSQGFFRLLQSNADRHPGCASHFADLSDPPDLYSSLHEEPCDPPESDMNPEDSDMVPREQDLRFTGDLYTPRWVRGHGNKRQGWCGLCKPGRWLVLKNSAFWYDKSFTHGVSAATGAAFQGPQDTRRTEGNLDVWEGLCGSCGEWIALVSSKKKGTTWFRHAYKCHTHPKVKDGPKRRRETNSNVRARTQSSSSSGNLPTISTASTEEEPPLTAVPPLSMTRPTSSSGAMSGLNMIPASISEEVHPLFKVENERHDSLAAPTTPMATHLTPHMAHLSTHQHQTQNHHLQQPMRIHDPFPVDGYGNPLDAFGALPPSPDLTNPNASLNNRGALGGST